ncbi:MAG TPA: ATP-binding cassette domain-containing protein, partial [Solirubrobacterales bacterium]|nr:ATP-binding cassette domain-containing protein [Solirubrobacterales bacterium]
HGLSGSIFQDDAGDCMVNLSETHGVGIKIEKLNKFFGDHHVLKDITLEILPGETFSIIGPSGTGKSILLKHIVKLETPDRGEIFIDGLPLFAKKKKTEMQRDYRYSMVFQSSALFNSLTVGENVGLWLREKRICKENRIKEIIREKLALVGLEGKEGLKTSELSGGMKKRVAIARSLAMNPDLILYDEPTADLDPILTEQIGQLIARIRTVRGNTQIIVTHNLPLARAIADRIAVLAEGRIAECVTPAELAASRHPLTREFLRASALAG